MHVLVDTNIVLDVLCNREPFVQDARGTLVKELESGQTAR